MIGFWLVPQQRRDEARVLFDSVVEELGWDTDRPIAAGADPTALPSMMPVFMGMILAREFGEHGLYAKLRAHAEEHYRPTWDAATGEFSWAFGFNEPHPRGQPNAIMATVEAMREGAWSAIGARPNLRKFIDPTVHGVDFPTLCLSQASYDPARRTLVVATDAGAPGKAGAPTSFRIANINPRDLQVTIDGRPSDAWRIVDGEVEIATTVGEHTFLIAQRG
ncbi:MAG: hypothetical protein EXQ96_03140 [Alphaproteobacteria bacterium]|nr:hypothetical protein [Alphaproteobacteria bacterium]